MTIPGYDVIEELAGTESYSLHRGRRREDQSPFLLKAPRHHPTTLEEMDVLRHEFEILRGLSVPGIICVQELLPGGCLVLEDTGGTPLQALLTARRLDLDSFFRIATQLAQTLAELHRREIIHKNVNPRSILVHATTLEVWLSDFAPASPLAYASPEQTGRINRVTDYRTDFYSLGVTFYELLTGARPFDSADPLELIHQHIAQTPTPPAEVNTEIPRPVSQIVMKLLSKTAEERYQSALGLKADLEICAREWAARGSIASFLLGRLDISDRFLIPQKLYGRNQELQDLLTAFDSVCNGPAAMLLVSGYSGIGKTSLIQELYRPIVRQRGYFISGKFDQVARNVPYGALIQAFRRLIQQLLTETEERLAVWRVRLSEALGANGGVLTEVIPEIELIVGPQSAPPPLGPAEALNRFQLVFRNFVVALAARKHPLVIFLDDLQWADSATLSLLRPLLTSADVQFLLLIGAYRENEVGAGHPLTRTLDQLQSDGAQMQRVHLGSLQPADLSLLIRDTLHGDHSEIEPLARLVMQKTDANPFFVIQFLKTLHQEGLLRFDPEQRRWTFHMEAIARAGITDNVIDLMTRKIQRLSIGTQRVLMLAASIGNQFDLTTAAVVSEQSPETVVADLKEAIQEGLVLAAPGSPAYTFLHDRVQQAAYAMIPAEQKPLVHLTVGRLLLGGCDPAAAEEKVFDIVHHLNVGSGLITDDTERLALARLNLTAGRRAKSSTAFQPASSYLNAGIALLTGERWSSDYELMLELHLEAAECEYLSGNFEEAEQHFHLLLQRAATRLDQARVHSLRIVLYENMSRYTEAVSSGKEGLSIFGISFPQGAEEKQAALESEVQAIQTLLGERSIGSLVDLPVMADSNVRMVMRILTGLWAPSYILGDQLLTRLISATMVRLSLAHGNTEESAYGYVTHAITVGPVRGDYQSAYEWGRLALDVNERFHDSKRRAKVHQQFNAHVNLWRQPMETCIPHAREACRSGLETGDFTYAGYGAFTESWPALLASRDLGRFVRDYSPNLDLLEKIKMTGLVAAQKVILNWARALQGQTSDRLSLSDANFDEGAYVAAYETNPFYMTFFYAAKLHLCVMFEEYCQGLETARKAKQVVQALGGTIWPVLLDFWSGLTLAGLYHNASEQERREYLQDLTVVRESLAKLAENCPENFLCFSLLIHAEIKRLGGFFLEAMDFYTQAIAYARKTGSLPNEALAEELYARFWRRRGNETIAEMYLEQARRRYEEWGAAAKLPAQTSRDLEPPSFDISTVAKAAHAIAQEIVLEDLLRKLMKIALENAGAQRGLFLKEKGGRLVIEAEAAVQQDDVRLLESVPLEEFPDLPRTVVQYVRKTGESVVLGNAPADDRFSRDPYVTSAQPLSILCVPVVHQKKVEGILYLENRLSTDAFTPDRIKVMGMISSQAAIALENARLYDEMKQEVSRRQEAEKTLRSIMEGTASVTGDDFFKSLVRHLASALQVRHAFVAECRDNMTRARTLAFWKGDSFLESIEYDLTGTPCLEVSRGGVGYHSKDLQARFPEDIPLVHLAAESYLGVPMFGASGQVIGHLVALDDKPMEESRRQTSVLKIFAARAAAELERLRAEDELRAALAEVEALKNRLQAENVYLQEEIHREHNFDEIVGNSPALLDLLTQVEQVAPTDSTILIYGETGTGKELIARAIHNHSARRDRPLVKVNCGAIPAGLVESELFGHMKGAFTGALERRTGRFELAHGGTIFLDEVGELPPETQVKLLRVLQEQEFEPVGSSRTVRVNVRIIAASNRDLSEAVAAGRFRSDLFYRLNVFPLTVPPLRERKSDIPQLVMFFVSRFAKKLGKDVRTVTQETMDRLMDYSWPGNVREMQNIVERAVVLAKGPVLALDKNLLPVQPGVAQKLTFPSPALVTLEEVERRHIRLVLEQAGWVIEGPKGAAHILNLHPNTLRSRMKKLRIERSRAAHEIS